MIKKQTKSFFCNSCRNCPNQGLCISATAVTKGLRKYFLNINGKREPTNLAMLQGKEFHENFFKHQKEIQEIGFNNLQRDLFAGKSVDIKELRVCSNFYSIRGIIDSLNLRLDLKNKTLHIEINELKTSFWKEYIFQLALYGLLFSDPNFKVIIPVTKRKTKLITKQLIPPNLNLRKNIKCRFIYKNSKPYEFDFMIDNELTDHAKGLCAVVQSRLAERRKLHGFGLKYINDVKPCKHCMKEKCGLYLPFCSKVADDFRKKTVQKYLGKKKLTIFHRPVIKRSEIRIR